MKKTLFLALFTLTVACDKKNAGVDDTASEKNKEIDVVAEQNTAGHSSYRRAFEQAQKSITVDNARAVLNEMSRQIDADVEMQK